MTLLEKAKLLKELRDKIDEKKKEMVPFEEEKEKVQLEILEEMKTTEQFSARFDFGTVTRAVRKTPRVADEKAAILWLEANNLKDEYTAVRLADHFDALMKIPK